MDKNIQNIIAWVVEAEVRFFRNTDKSANDPDFVKKKVGTRYFYHNKTIKSIFTVDTFNNFKMTISTYFSKKHLQNFQK